MLTKKERPTTGIKRALNKKIAKSLSIYSSTKNFLAFTVSLYLQCRKSYDKNQHSLIINSCIPRILIFLYKKQPKT